MVRSVRMVFLLPLLVVPPVLSGQALSPPEESAALESALDELRRAASAGGWSPLPGDVVLRPGESHAVVPRLRERLRRSGDLAGPGIVPDLHGLYDPLLEAAVRRFQGRHGLDVDGVVGRATRAALDVPVEVRIRQVELNVARRRVFSPEPDPFRILVNIPGFEAWIVEEGKEPTRHRVSVGRPDRPTPILSGRMTVDYVVLAPFWNVPPGILARDKLPLLRRDPGALHRQSMTVMDRRTGQPAAGSVDWNSIDAAEFNSRFWLRQDPGPGNALGQVKFIFPNPEAVYLHDTPDRHLFDRGRRAFSSGCMRIERPLELAERMLRPLGWEAERIRATVARGVEQWVRLPVAPPIQVVYWTAWVDRDGVLHLADDLYGLDAREVERGPEIQRGLDAGAGHEGIGDRDGALTGGSADTECSFTTVAP